MLNDPVTTKTGIVIGGAWTPRRSARYAEAIEYPSHRRSGYGRAAGTMVVALLSAAWLVTLLAWGL